MRPVVVASSELADGFRLAGIPVVELEDEGKIPEVIRRIDEIVDVAIVLVDERFIDPFERAFAGRDFPMVASYPAEEVQRDRSYIDELTLRYLGQKIYVEGESES